jgi:hypothetical protein
MTITAVGAQAVNGGTGVTTVAVAPTALGDVLALAITSQDPPSGSGVTSVSGGGVTTWNRGTSYFDTATTTYVDTWWGIITATGAATITTTGLPGTTEFTVLWTQQFHSTLGALSQAGAGVPAGGSSGPSLGSGLAVSWPALAPSGAAEYLYLGNGISVFGTLNAGSSPGYAYPSTGFSSNRPIYNPAYAGGFPTSTQTNTGAYDTVAVLLGAGTAAPATMVPVAGEYDPPVRRKLWD